MAFIPRRTTKYNEAFFRGMGGPGPTAIGLVMVVLIVAGVWLAFTKQLPFTGPGYQLEATFSNSVNIRDRAPVRIAGVNVGEVTGSRLEGDTAVVTFTVNDEGQPVHADAEASIRPRIFLEGNFFIDLDPGSPTEPELEDGGQIPVSRTSTAVQFDEILTALQTNTRADLQELVAGLGTAFTLEPGPAADRDQDPDVRGKSAAEALNETFGYGAEGNRDIAIVNEALLGAEPDDLSRLIRGLDRTFVALTGHEEQLQGLISKLNTFIGALADQSGNLGESIALLAPTLERSRTSLVSLNQALPALRGFAIALEPGVAELPALIRAGTPWLAQTTPLLSERELGGSARILARSAPSLAGASAATAGLLPQLTDFGRCVSRNLIPTGNVVLDDSFGGSDFSTGAENYKSFFYALVNLAGEAQTFDGNGPAIRVQPGGGPVPVKLTNPSGGFQAEELFGNTIAPPLGSRPQTTGMPPLNPNRACHTQRLPNLNGPAAAAGPPSPTVYTPAEP